MFLGIAAVLVGSSSCPSCSQRIPRHTAGLNWETAGMAEVDLPFRDSPFLCPPRCVQSGSEVLVCSVECEPTLKNLFKQPVLLLSLLPWAWRSLCESLILIHSTFFFFSAVSRHILSPLPSQGKTSVLGLHGKVLVAGEL